jgi:NADH-quinone oxidoreductase subunit C
MNNESPSEELIQQITSLATDITTQTKANRPAVNVPLTQWLSVAEKLKTEPRFQFDMLCDYTAVDWPEEQNIELIYQLYSTELKNYLLVCVRVPRAEAKAPSMINLWPIAEWQEREIYDLFGVRFANHPDLRRIFLDDDWAGHPLLKDYKDDFMLERPW